MASRTPGPLKLQRKRPRSHNIVLSGAIDEAGIFHELPFKLNTDRICELYQERVFQALLNENLLDEETVASMKTWTHSGFSVFASDPIPPHDSERLLFLARYLKRCPVSCERMAIDESAADEPKVLYSSYKDGVPVSTRQFSPLQFLAELSQHIPIHGSKQRDSSACTQHAQGAPLPLGNNLLSRKNWRMAKNHPQRKPLFPGLPQ